uniref:GRIP domain-containing protein n=1 Tax=Rhabditophanes sp. KR3021 TaxID=114890 RepID=A0AC35U8V7_9BILA
MNQDYDNREELEILKESIGKQDIVICKLENDFKLSKQENEELKENVENKRMDVEKVTKDLSSLRKKYESSKRNLEMMEKKYSSELESKNAISKELNETKNKETLNLHQMDILNQKAKAIYDKYTLAKNNLSELNQKYVSETESKNTLVVEVNNLRNMLKENEKEIEQLTEQNKTLHAKLDASLVIRKSPTNEVGDLTNGLFNSTSNSFTFLHNYNENTTKFKESLENIKKIVDSINMFKRNFESVKAEIVSNTAAKYDKILLEKVAKLAIPLDIYKKMSKTLKDEVDSLNKEREELEHFKIGTFEYMEKLVKQHKFGNFSDGNFSTFWSSLAQHITECKSTIQKQAKIIGVLKPQERVSMKPRKLFSEDGSISPIAKEKASSQETNNDPIITEFLLSYNKAMEQVAVKKSEIIQLKYIIENNKKAISQCENDASERQMEMESKIKVLEQTLEEKHGYLAVVLKREKKAKVIVKKLAETMINHFNLHHKDMGTNCEAYQFYSIIKHATSLLQKQ